MKTPRQLLSSIDKKLKYKVQAGSEVCAPKGYVVPMYVCVHLYIYGHVCVEAEGHCWTSL